MNKLKEITAKVIGYCSIPQYIAKENCSINEVSNDAYVLYSVTSKKDQAKYDDDFALDDWIISKYPELEGKSVFIHIDY